MERRDIPDELLDTMADQLKALADPTRLRILHCLRDEGLCVGDLVERLGCSQANVSKHLATLRHHGLVTSERCGMNVCYTLAEPIVFDICSLVCRSLERRASGLELAAALAGDYAGSALHDSYQEPAR